MFPPKLIQISSFAGLRTRLDGFVVFHLTLDMAFKVHSMQIQPLGFYSDEDCHETVISWWWCEMDTVNSISCHLKMNASLLDLVPDLS